MECPDPSEIHVWLADLGDSPDPWNSAWQALNDDERRRADRYLAPAARNAFVRTRGRLRVLLGEYLKRRPAALELEFNAYGKPRLHGSPENRGLVFNVSHTRGLAVLSFAWDTQLGADVEETKPRARLDRLADACLAPCEKSRWLAAPAEHRPGEFTRHWVGKEAWVKATGRGISAGLRHVVVAPDYSSYLSVPTGYGPAEAWHLREWAHRNRWVAVAWGGAKRRLRLLE